MYEPDPYPDHQVEEGETLEQIARTYRLTALELRRFNRRLFPVGEAKAVEPGMRLLVFEPLLGQRTALEEEASCRRDAHQ